AMNFSISSLPVVVALLGCRRNVTPCSWAQQCPTFTTWTNYDDADSRLLRRVKSHCALLRVRETPTRDSGGAHLHRLDRFDADLLGDLRLVARELRRRLHRVVPRVRQVDLERRLDAPGTRRHDRDAVRHEDRLVDVVRDEEHGFPVRLPD